MKNKINKLVSLLMVFFMTFGLFAPLAIAEENVENVRTPLVDGTETGEIVVNLLTDEDDPFHEVNPAGIKIEAYQIAYVDFKNGVPQGNVYEWVDEVQDWINNHEKYSELYSQAKDFVVENDSPEAIEFYDTLSAAIRSGEISLDSTKSRDGSGTIKDLPMGNYLILIENGLRVYTPSSVNLIPVWDKDAWYMDSPRTVNVKSTAVGITKTVTNVTSEAATNSASIGDTLHYVLTMDVPLYHPNSKNKKFVVSDVISGNLVIDYDSIEVFDDSEEKLEAKIELENGTEKTIYNITNSDENGDIALKTDSGKKVNFQVEFDYESIKEFQTVIITYDAKVANTVDIGPDGNDNTAYFEYSNNPYSTDETYWVMYDNAIVYSYGIDVLKYSSDYPDGLAGAHFNLVENDPGEGGENNYDAMRFVKTTREDGTIVYRLATSEDVDSEEIETTEDLEVDENGRLIIEGLRGQSYWIRETAPPDGYIQIKGFRQIEILDQANDERDGKVEYLNGDGKLVVTDLGKEGYAELPIENKHGFSLPETGGIGTIIFTVVGIVLMGVGVIIFKKIRNRDNN